MLQIRSTLISLLILLFARTASAQDDLNVLDGWMQYTDARNALYHHLTGEAFELLEERRKMLAAFNSLEQWKERQQWIKRTLNEIVGPFPEKTPLNARIVRSLEKDYYRVEHIIFESQPQFYVTSSLFIPKSIKRNTRAPAVIYCSGHSESGYRSEVYQHVILNLVKKGFIVFAFDPVGQGERLEYFDVTKGQPVGGPTTQHSYPGSQAFITGSSQARYMIWDGIRAVDYLLTRKEVDPSRIGITGRSGGGTQSSYIAAFDERIAAAAPECYITSFTRLLQSIGPQDAEQNFLHGIAKGIDHGDLLIVRAPKPTLMITTTRDIFSIQGARETAAEVSRAFEAFGNKANFNMVEDDAPHASTKKNREAMYAFFQRHLNNPGNSGDEETRILSAQEIMVTSTGQISTSMKGLTVFDLNLAEAKRIATSLNDGERADRKSEIISTAKTLSGYRQPDRFERAVFTGRIQREGYAIEKYYVKGEGEYVIPFLMVVPSNNNGKTVLYLHPAGKNAEASPGGEIEQLAKRGFTVVAPDLPGVGELGAGEFKGDAFIGGISHNIWYSAILIGRSIAGLQAGDVARVLSSVETIKSSNVYAIARKEMASVLLHAAAFNPAIAKVALIEPLTSYRSVVGNRSYHSPFITGAVPGMLRTYDLPDLAASLAPRDLLVINPVDGSGEMIPNATTDVDVEIPRKAYSAGHNSQYFAVVENISPQDEIRKIIERWPDASE